MQPADPKAQLMRVVRGEADWRSLNEFGFGIEQELIAGGVHWDSAEPMPASVDPSIEDFAAGVLQLRERPEQLREWARFVLAASPLVGFEAFEGWPHQDEFVGAIWDLSGLNDPAAAATLVRIAEAIRNGSA